MTEFIIIAAMAKNNVIGKGPDIPWLIKEDFKHFKKITMGQPCLMGDVTYESLPDGARPLPGRENLVLTFNNEYAPKGAMVFLSWDDAIEYCMQKEKVYICGGASIYKQGLKVATSLELTKIHKEYEGDVYFPDIDFNQWELIKEVHKEGKNIHTDETVEFSFLTYKKSAQ